MGVLRWSLQAQWKFTLVWTLIQTFGGVLLFVVAQILSKGFPIEALFVAGSMPFAGLISGPVMWRALMARRSDAANPQNGKDDA